VRDSYPQEVESTHGSGWILSDPF